jgi:hypothetical protein
VERAIAGSSLENVRDYKKANKELGFNPGTTDIELSEAIEWSRTSSLSGCRRLASLRR